MFSYKKIILLTLVVALGLGFAVPAMRNSLLERYIRGECTLQGGFRSLHCQEDVVLRTRPASPNWAKPYVTAGFGPALASGTSTLALEHGGRDLIRDGKPSRLPVML